MLDPQARALLELIRASDAPPLHALAPVDARVAYAQRRLLTQAAPRAMAEVENIGMPGPAGVIGLRLYRAEPKTEESTPAMVYFHGGGWTIGDLDTHDVLCRDLAAQSGCVVVSVDYRLGPEHRFPAAVDDCVAAYRWIRQSAKDLGLDRERFAIGGDSAGGNLTAVATLVLRDAKEALPCIQLLIYPATDMRAVAPSHKSNGQGYLLTSDTVAYFRTQYIPDRDQWSDWRASPLLHPDLSGLPPALIVTAGFDPLRDEGRQYANALSAAGSRAQYVCFERQIHGFITMGKAIDEANTAVTLCAQVVRRSMLERLG